MCIRDSCTDGCPRRHGPCGTATGDGMTEQITFAGLSIVLVGSALAVVLSKNLFHAVLWLAHALPGTARVFLRLHAEFLAAVQLLLYAGGIITIVVFAIVVTERPVSYTHLRAHETPEHLVCRL